MGEPAFRTLLTHGFMVDKDGKKLSKSKGASLKDLFDRFGADVLRWWVCGIAYENDVKVDEEFFKLAGESYRKVRNTFKFMLSNLNGFVADDSISFEETSLEAWVLGEFDTLREKVLAAYKRLRLPRSAQADLQLLQHHALGRISFCGQGSVVL